MSANHQYNVTPEKQASLPRFFYNQLTVTPTEVRDVDLRGKTAIVTGANSGVGFESSRQLLDLGLSKLILAVRSEEKGNAALAKLSQGRTIDANAIEVWLINFSDYSSVVSFAERTKSLEHLDIVILSVGIFPASRTSNERTKHDEMIQVNYLSTALLTILLLPICKAKKGSQPARITVVSSEVSAWTSFKERNERPLLSALDKPGNINLLDRMMVSKLLGQLFLTRLTKLVPTTVAIINSASPGGLHDTGFGNEHEKGVIAAIVKSVQRRMYYTSAVGSRTVVDAAVRHGKETHGEFFSFQKMVP
jgi:NAD(P)-dependent dehydrogenase (short-subunit alcohol dehydrogenase family)